MDSFLATWLACLLARWLVCWLAVLLTGWLPYLGCLFWLTESNSFTVEQTNCRAAARGHARFCEWLLRRGALVHRRERTNGWTALHLAAINSRLEVATLLVEDADASAKAMDDHGDIPHECAPRAVKGERGNDARSLRKLLRPMYKATT